jgi:hypothetical protein
VIGASPTHVPGELDPTTGLPRSSADELAGLLPGVATTDVAALVASVVPPPLLADTRTRMADVGNATVYVWRVAPSIVERLVGRVVATCRVAPEPAVGDGNVRGFRFPVRPEGCCR